MNLIIRWLPLGEGLGEKTWDFRTLLHILQTCQNFFTMSLYSTRKKNLELIFKRYKIL